MAEEELGGVPGEGTPLDRWIPLLYDELRALAGKLLSDRGAAVTLQPTSLVHEAYLRLVGQRNMDWQNRLHFFAVAARVMRRVLVDHCRAHLAQKRGGALLAVELAEAAAPAPREVDVLTVDRLLTDLAGFDAQQERIVELRFFAGLTVEETAEALGISKATVKRDWALAKAWMAQQMAEASTPYGPDGPDGC
ncbi:MAG TPA: ECF-type sigma factor [Thermoanaerobaculia bacterium]|jgi:RNA polymerase sigma factor (TIGR02999 family)|nr:ECF-type sigma factor [Thermoanaerobaculia bacterium]